MLFRVATATTPAIPLQVATNRPLRRQPEQQADKVGPPRPDPPTQELHTYVGEVIATLPAYQSSHTSQRGDIGPTGDSDSKEIAQAVAEELATLLMVGGTSEEDSLTTQKARRRSEAVAAAAAASMPAAFAIAAGSSPIITPVTVASAAEFPDQADFNPDQKDTVPTTLGSCTGVQQIRKSADNLASPQSPDASLASEARLAGSIVSVPEARMPPRDCSLQKDIGTFLPIGTEVDFRPLHHFFRPTSYTPFAPRQYSSVLSFLGARAPLSISIGPKYKPSTPKVLPDTTVPPSNPYFTANKPDSVIQCPSAPTAAIQHTQPPASITDSQHQSATTRTSPEEPSDTTDAAPSPAAETPRHSSQKNRPEAAYPVAWSEQKAFHRFPSNRPKLSAPYPPTAEPVEHQEVTLPKRREDLARIKIDDRSTYKGYRSTDSNIADMLEAFHEISSDWWTDSSNSREGGT
jgi:hypothetical protein